MRKLDLITIQDKAYPKQLKKIKNPPKQLYIKGDETLLKTNIISIIGSRACSKNGEQLAHKFAKELVYQDITIASGMALGIDTIAHQTALEQKGKTIAVLGSGWNHIFPSKNKGLYQQIIEKGGLVITEYPPEEEVKSENFLHRNRIVSGIALAILVVEAAYRSGTSVTAKIATQQGRKVFALPHEVNNLHGVGTNRLIQKGAKMITNTEQIIKEFPFLTYKMPPSNEKIPINRKVCKNKEYHEVYQIITEKPISISEIYQKAHKTMGEINTILLKLELEGLIQKVAGGYQCILEKK